MGQWLSDYDRRNIGLYFVTDDVYPGCGSGEMARVAVSGNT